jgi:DNA-binding response OmpR family regulator
MQILLVEDDERIIEFVRRGLVAEGHGVTVTDDGEDAVALAQHPGWSVIVLDLLLPRGDGREICRALRAAGVRTPVLMLTAVDALEDKVAGLRMGADDYLTKPFSFQELLARIEALGRRSGAYQVDEPVLTFADLTLDRRRRVAMRAGRPIELTPREFALFECLLSEPGKVFSRTMLLERVWGYASDPLTNVVEVYIRQLRRKVDDGHDVALIRTVRGFGYTVTDQ